MSLRWYALHSHPHKEDMLWKQLEASGFEVFYPRLHVRPVNPRSRKIRPYFPGYLFVRVDLQEAGLSIFNWMPYSTGLVSFGGEPSVVSDALIQALQQRMQELQTIQRSATSGYQSGDAIQVETGPFAGFEGIFDVALSGNERVRVLLKLLSRDVPVELPTHQIRKKNPRSSG